MNSISKKSLNLLLATTSDPHHQQPASTSSQTSTKFSNQKTLHRKNYKKILKSQKSIITQKNLHTNALIRKTNEKLEKARLETAKQENKDKTMNYFINVGKVSDKEKAAKKKILSFLKK